MTNAQFLDFVNKNALEDSKSFSDFSSSLDRLKSFPKMGSFNVFFECRKIFITPL